MAEVLFYHLTRSTLAGVLPGLLTRALERGWKVVVQSGRAETVQALDRHLWTYDQNSFLPHGAAGCPAPEQQPVFLTAGSERPNQADALFLVDGARLDAAEAGRLERVCLFFDSADDAATGNARADWKLATESGLAAVYWSEESGKWKEMART